MRSLLSLDRSIGEAGFGELSIQWSSCRDGISECRMALQAVQIASAALDVRHHSRFRNTAAASAAACQFCSFVRPDALRGARSWLPSGAQCRAIAGDRS